VLACLAGQKIPYEVTGDMIQVATESAHDVAKTLLDSCEIKKVITRPATLEDVFLKLTGRTLRE
jgi:lipooligosaccharide transport system ATP-binding protein